MRILHTMLRVGDLDRSLAFYTDVLGMRELRRQDYPSGRFTLAFVGYGPESGEAVLELTLKEFIGPIANMICADHFRVVTNLATAIDALADEIPNPGAATQFRERVRQRLS